jgi:enoyl-CoA hydratase/carnithine racemase
MTGGPPAEVTSELHADRAVGVVVVSRPPNNYLDFTLLDQVCGRLHELDADPRCHALLLRSVGKHFCAGRDFSRPRAAGDSSADVYRRAADLLTLDKPWVAAVQGGAVGAGMGLALAADFRVAAGRAYFWPNFVNVGLHPGFGLSLTLPRVVGQQRATRMLLSGSRIGSEQALADGLADQVVDEADLAEAALAFAGVLAAQPAEALRSTRRTLRGEGFRAAFEQATAWEVAEQGRLRALPSR